MKQRIKENNETIEEYRKKLNWMHDIGRGEKDEGLLLLIAVIGLSVAVPLGLLLAPIIVK